MKFPVRTLFDLMSVDQKGWYADGFSFNPNAVAVDQQEGVVAPPSGRWGGGVVMVAVPEV
jgi:hypothetical protein